MKILILEATLSHGGAERVVSNLSNKLSAMGHEIELLLYYDRPIFYAIDDQVKITIDEQEMGGKKNPLQHMCWRRKYIQKTKPDAIISFLAPFNMLNILALLGVKIPLIVADRNDPRSVPTAPVMRKARDFLYHFADGVVLQSEHNKSYFSKKIQKKSKVIYNSICLGAYSGAALQVEKTNRIVSVGRLIPQKNPMMLVKAFEKIADAFPLLTVSFYGSGELQEELEQYVAKSAIAGRVVFHGVVKNIFDEIQNAKVFVMTSQYEGLPNALLEAMCLGLPVISTKVSGAIDFIQPGKNGELVSCNDVDGLAEALKALLNNQERLQAYGQAGASVATVLDETSVANRWLDAIARCKEKQ